GRAIVCSSTITSSSGPVACPLERRNSDSTNRFASSGVSMLPSSVAPERTQSCGAINGDARFLRCRGTTDWLIGARQTAQAPGDFQCGLSAQGGSYSGQNPVY